MKKIIILFLVAVLFVGCSPQKRLSRLLDKYPLPTHDSISYVERIKLDTITVFTKADTVMLMFRAPCPDMEVTDDNPKVKTKVIIKDQVMTVKTICKEDSLEIIIKELKTELVNKETVYVNVPGPEVPVKYTPKFWIYGTITALCLIILIVLYILYRTNTKGLRTVLNGFLGK